VAVPVAVPAPVVTWETAAPDVPPAVDLPATLPPAP
jgi:hypothetical protein